jgi:DNA polymerase-4
MKLLNERYSFSKPLRSLGIRACDLISEADGIQLSFGSENQERIERLESSVNRLRNRFGRSAILRARLLGADIIGESDPLTHDVHPVAFFR